MGILFGMSAWSIIANYIRDLLEIKLKYNIYPTCWQCLICTLQNTFLIVLCRIVFNFNTRDLDNMYYKKNRTISINYHRFF